MIDGARRDAEIVSRGPIGHPRALTLALLLLAACAESAGGAGQVDVGVSAAALSGADAARVVLSISAPDIDPTISHALSYTAGQWQGVVGDIPAGAGRVFDVVAYDAGGGEICRGEATGVDVAPGETVTVAILLQQSVPPSIFHNATPSLQAVFVAPGILAPNGRTTVWVVASDPDPGDVLDYRWTSAVGAFDAMDLPRTAWTAPAVEGSYAVMVEVADEKHASRSVAVNIDVTASGGPRPGSSAGTPVEGATTRATYASTSAEPGLRFLPPLGPPEGVHRDPFDPTLLDRLEVRLESTGADGTRLEGSFTSSTSTPLVLLGPHELYFVNVPAARYFTDPSRAYRFVVLRYGRVLGSSDMAARVFEVMSWVPSLPVGVKLRIEDHCQLPRVATARSCTDQLELRFSPPGDQACAEELDDFLSHDACWAYCAGERAPGRAIDARCEPEGTPGRTCAVSCACCGA